MQFKDVIGQQPAKLRLIQSVKEGRIPHAQLLAGPSGNGKLALALAYAQYINCRQRTDDDSCGVCPSCRKISKLIHPDLHFSIPVIKTDKFKEPTTDDYIDRWRKYLSESPYVQYEKWMSATGEKEKQGMIYVFEASALLNKLSKKSYEAEYKVTIVWLPELMNDQCANKILKLLEEPPANTVFLMVSEAEEQLLSTIRSRCQLIRVPKITDSDLEAALVNHPALGSSNPSVIARLARGNYLAAIDLLQEDEARKFNHEKFSSLMRSGYKPSLEELIDWGDEMGGLGSRVRQLSFLEYCNQYLRENFLLNLREPDLIYLDEAQSAFSQRFAPFINESNILPLYQEFDQAYRDIASNGNGKLIFLDLAIKVSRLIRGK